MPRTEDQLKDLRGKKRQLIMNTALKLFANKGFASTPISLIAKEAEISKGLIYNYFSSKEDLIINIIMDGLQDFFDIFDPNHDANLTDEEFSFFIEKSFDLLKENINLWKLYFMVMMQQEVIKLIEEELMNTLMPMIEILVKYFASKGVENPMAYARLWGAMMDGISINYVLDPGNFPIEEIKKILIEKFTL